MYVLTCWYTNIEQTTYPQRKRNREMDPQQTDPI